MNYNKKIIIFILPILIGIFFIINQPKTEVIKIGTTSLKVEIANTSVKIQKGLSKRTELKNIDGMLFVFPESQFVSFWMKDTLFNLDIAFINSDGKIIKIQQMFVGDEATYKSPSPVKFALEVPLGYFNSNKIKEGDFLSPLY